MRTSHTNNKYLAILLLTLVFGFFSFAYSSNRNFGSSYIQKDRLLAYIPSIPLLSRFNSPFLTNYPFRQEDNIAIAEGYAYYDGNLKDTPGDLHWGIDYVKRVGQDYNTFNVYSAHSGTAVRGFGKTWGKFVVVRYRDNRGDGFNTLYAHLDDIPENIPYYSKDFNNDRGLFIKNMTLLGAASDTGNAKGINQLHFELHIIGKGYSYRMDPYGVYDRLSSGLYPNPGSSLFGLKHFWNKSLPDFSQ